MASLTYNAAHDALRELYPERARLRTRLRHALTHDERLALWSVNTTLTCGLRAWAAELLPPRPLSLPSGAVTPAMRDRENPAAALVALFERTGAPAAFDDVIAVIGALWHVVDATNVEVDHNAIVSREDPVSERLERRQFLAALWREVQELRPMQRRALLLNLREAATVNVLSLFVVTGVATVDELAAALEMPPAELIGIWNDLPLDDQRLAAMLHVSRQQVINLRKSARERLRRRLLKGPAA